LKAVCRPAGEGIRERQIRTPAEPGAGDLASFGVYAVDVSDIGWLHRNRFSSARRCVVFDPLN
jgi:hypothetical protein